MDKLLAVDELRFSCFGEFLLRQRLIKPGSERYNVILVRAQWGQTCGAPL
jgi:hypothetical protein